MYDPNDLKELTSEIMYTERVIRKPNKVVRYYFENGYGASVACHEGSYGGPDGLYEMALLKGDNLHYEESGIWSDVIGYLTCLLYTSPSPRDGLLYRMPSSA